LAAAETETPTTRAMAAADRERVIDGLLGIR
jgi:hypothetical protein